MKKKFKFKNMPMLVAALTLADHFESEKQLFIAEVPSWDDPFISDFRASIEAVLSEYYGIDTKEELKAKTRIVNELVDESTDDLSMIKTQIERGFRTSDEKCSSILDKLGYSSYWPKASKKNQSELISLLLAFRNNLSAELRTELEGNGVNTERLSNIISYADSLSQANITQESLKGSSKLETESAVAILNDVYDQAMDICLIGQRLFKKDKIRKGLFVFSKLVKDQSAD